MGESVRAMSADFVVHGNGNDRVVILNQAVTWLLTIDGNVIFEGQSSQVNKNILYEKVGGI